MAAANPFSITNTGNSGPITATSSSAATAYKKTGMNQIMVTNEGTTTIYIASGDSTVVATTLSTPVPTGQFSFSVPVDHTYFALISPGGSVVVHVTCGEGL